MKIKKLAAFVLSVVMLVSGFSVAFAETSANAMVLEAEEVTANLDDETVEVEISATANPGYVNGLVDIGWDETALVLKDIEFTTVAPDNGCQRDEDTEEILVTTPGEYTIAFGKDTWTKDRTTTGTFFTLIFEPAENAIAGKYDITIEAGVDKYSILNAAEVEVPFEGINGSVTFEGEPAAQSFTITTENCVAYDVTDGIASLVTEALAGTHLEFDYDGSELDPDTQKIEWTVDPDVEWEYPDDDDPSVILLDMPASPLSVKAAVVDKHTINIRQIKIDVSKKEYVIPANTNEYTAFRDFMYTALENEQIFYASDAFTYFSGDIDFFDLNGDNIPDIYVKGLYYFQPTSMAEDIEYELPPIKVGRVPITLTTGAVIKSGLNEEDYENIPLDGDAGDILVFDQVEFVLGQNNNKYTVDLSKAPFSTKNVPNIWEMDDFAFVDEKTRDYVKLEDFMRNAAKYDIITYEIDSKNEDLIYFDLDKDGNNDISFEYTENAPANDNEPSTYDMVINKLKSTNIKGSYKVSLNPLFEKVFEEDNIQVMWYDGGSSLIYEFYEYSYEIGPIYTFNDVTFVFSSGPDDDISGTCGDNLTWILDTEGTLTISGTGDMWNFKGETWYYSPSFSDTERAPWYQYRSFVIDIVIEDGVTGIGDFAFDNCSKFNGLTIPDSITRIGSHAFKGCEGLVSIEIPNSVVNIGDWTFWGCSNLESAVIPDNMTSIVPSMFDSCISLKSLDIPESVTSIGASAFAYCSSLEDIVIPSAVTSIGWHAFLGCESLTSIAIPDSVTKLIGNTSPEGYDTGEGGIFGFCSGLTSIIIPVSVTTVEDCVFMECYNITDVYYIGSEDQWNDIFIDYGNDALFNAELHYNSDENLKTYPLVVNTNNFGTASANYSFAEAGTRITITANPYSGYELDKITYIPEGSSEREITSTKSFIMPAKAVTVYVTFKEIEPEIYTIIVETEDGGVAYTSVEEAYAGDFIEVTAIPDEGFEINEVVLYAGMEEWSIEPDEDGRYIFEMPDTDVRVNVKFKEILQPCITVPNTMTYAGEQFELPITISNNPGIISMEFTVEYDDTLLELSEIKEGIYGGYFDGALNGVITWIADDVSVNETTNGVIATLVFNVDEEAGAGQTDITVTQINITYDEDNVFNVDEANVYFGIIPGEVMIKSYIPGDMNGDGQVTNKDVTRIMRYIKYRDVEIVEAALDVNGDGKINNKDVTRLMRYVKYGDVEIY